MKILSINSKLTYEIEVRKSGENSMPCPECNSDRKHKGRKSFSWNGANKVGYCQNCNSRFVEYKPFIEKKQYVVPTVVNDTQLTEQALKWFEGRGISQTTLKKMGVYSSVEYMPQVETNRNVICFPYYVDEKLVNIKYRDGAKNFKLVAGAELVFYNLNSILGKKECIIQEGEIDVLSYIEAGIDYCISVPNGASTRTMDYLDNYIDIFDEIEVFYIATDNDIKGVELREELIRRLGVERCKIVNFKDCKDANEYLVRYGGLALHDTLTEAIDVPVSGIIDMDNQYDDIYKMYISGMERGKLSGISDLDQRVTWELGRLAVVTGIPSHGKSEVVDFLVTNLNRVNGWKVGYFSPENYPIKYHFAKIASKISGKKFHRDTLSQEEFESTFEYIEKNFRFIYPEDDLTYQNIIKKAEYLVRKNGIKILVIDPYNKIEHLRNSGESETDYISRFLDKLIVFSKKFNVLTILVAHPRKMDKKADGTMYNKPTMYDINGSANFYNKCDYGITVYRYFNDNKIDVDIIKVKFRHLGDGGLVQFKFNDFNGRYESIDSLYDSWSRDSYLLDKEIVREQLPFNTSFDFNNNTETVPF